MNNLRRSTKYLWTIDRNQRTSMSTHEKHCNSMGNHCKITRTYEKHWNSMHHYSNKILKRMKKQYKDHYTCMHSRKLQNTLDIYANQWTHHGIYENQRNASTKNLRNSRSVYGSQIKPTINRRKSMEINEYSMNIDEHILKTDDVH